MRKSYKLSMVVLSIALLISLTTIISAESKSIVPVETIKNKFSEIKEITNHADEIFIVGPDFSITNDRYVFFKKNLELIHEIGHNGPLMTENEMIRALSKKELVFHYAQNQGIKVSEQEINDAIAEQKRKLYEVPDTSDSAEVIREIMKQRIAITGLNSEEFWKSDFTRNEYLKSITIGKLYSEMLADKKMKSYEDFDAFQNRLYDENVSKIQIFK
ncbi:hypothetical protein [Cohnella panacarvi]|uniref:hypothetical protein n=1 Tax=Cohnella panacarvi TaxID=400776 RepID=UPI00047B0D17|nr:hypothetical protein [Cohnella panacarvi]